MSSHTVSILIPCYNCAQFLSECLDSVLAQSHTEIEVICIDDGSIDSTWNILSEYALRDNRLKAIRHQTNKGISTTRNELLNNASGEFIQFVDSDDWIDTDMTKNMLALLESESDMAYCGHDIRSIDGKLLSTPQIVSGCLNKEQMINFFLTNYSTGSLCNKVIRRSLFSGIRFNDRIKDGEDADVVWEIIKKTSSTVMTRDVFYHYRTNPNSITKSRISADSFTQLPMWESIEHDCKMTSSPNHDVASTRLISRCISLLIRMYYQDFHNRELEEYTINLIKARIKTAPYVATLNYNFKRKTFATILCASPRLARSSIRIISPIWNCLRKT